MDYDDTALPDDDIDARLARQFGIALESVQTRELLAASSDPFVVALSSFAADEARARRVDEAQRQSAWEGIHASISADNSEPVPGRSFLRLVSSHATHSRLAVAASIVLACVLTIAVIVSLRNNPTKLIAEAGATDQSVSLPDGTEIVLRRHSSLYKRARTEGARHYKLVGEASFDVEHDSSTPFIIDAGRGTITVLGTRFIVSTWGSETRVFLSEGSVRLNGSESTSSILLEPGQSASVTSVGELTLPVAAAETEYSDWLDGVLVFERREVSSVVAELAYHFGIAINVDPSSGSETITGTVRLETLDSTLASLATVLNGTFQKQDEGRYDFVAER